MYTSLLNHPDSLFAGFDRLRRELDEVFAAGELPRSIRSVAAGSQPAVNIGRTATSVEIYVFAPGLDPARIDVTLDRGVLRIAGERAADPAVGDGARQIYTHERGSGGFARAVALPDDIDPGQVRASYRDGLLQVSVARRESAQPRRIAVQ